MKKKLICSVLAFVMLFSVSLPSFATGEALGEYVMQIDENKTVTVVVPEEFRGEVTYAELYDIASGTAVRDGDIVTIQDVRCIQDVEGVELMAVNPDAEAEALAGWKYTTEVRAIGTESVISDYFIISVAKGMTVTLSDTFTKTHSLTIQTGDTPFLIAGTSLSLTYSVSTSISYSGPGESSGYNSREYRVQFYGAVSRWHQYRYTATGVLDSTRTGIGNCPTRYATYSLDHKIEG